jgi:thymidylate synthase
MKQYHDLVNYVLKKWFKRRQNRNRNKSVFGYQMRFDLSEGFPMLPQKIAFKIYYLRTVVVLKGDTNIDYLKGNGVKIWDDWANENGDLGPVYGHQWRNWNSEEIDQITEIIATLKTNPNSRMLVSA